MKENKENILKVVYPNIFPENFYFECSDGWFDLISEICEFVSKRTNKLHAAQVKEKFGTLRFYYDIDEGLDEETSSQIFNFISEIERKSKHVCEDCGISLTADNRCPQAKLGYWIGNVCMSCHNLAEEEASKKIEAKAYKLHESKK